MWTKDCGFSFSISPSNEYLELISLGLTGLISLLSKGPSRVFSSITTCCKVELRKKRLSAEYSSFASRARTGSPANPKLVTFKGKGGYHNGLGVRPINSTWTELEFHSQKQEENGCHIVNSWCLPKFLNPNLKIKSYNILIWLFLIYPMPKYVYIRLGICFIHHEVHPFKVYGSL